MTASPFEHGRVPLGELPWGYWPDMDRAVSWTIAPNGEGTWIVTDYQAAKLVLADRRFSREAAVAPETPKLAVHEPSPESIMSRDGEAHARLRRLVAGAFTEARMADLRPSVEKISYEFIDRMQAQGSPADLVAAYSSQLSLEVMCHILGVPTEDQHLFRTLVPVLFDLTGDPAEGRTRAFRLAQYMTKLVNRKRKEPGDDLLSTLTQAAEGSDRLSGRELVTLCLSLLMAGFDSTGDQITLCFLSVLAEGGDRWSELRARPEAVPETVEGILRWNPSATLSFTRVATEPVQLADVTVEPGQPVVVFLMGANRTMTDEQAWRGSIPRHLTFGHGPHRCVGAPLARLQLSVALRTVTERFPRFELAEDLADLQWKTGGATRGLKRMTVAW